MCVGVDSSKRQCEWCRQRLQVFANMELLLAASVRDGMDPKSPAYQELSEAAKMTTLPDPQVNCRVAGVHGLRPSTAINGDCMSGLVTKGPVRVCFGGDCACAIAHAHGRGVPRWYTPSKG